MFPCSLDACIEDKPEALREFEAAVDSLKTRRRKLDEYDEAEVDEVIAKLCTRMRVAAEDDRVANEEKKPALAKLKLLPKVMLLLEKYERTQ